MGREWQPRDLKTREIARVTGGKGDREMGGTVPQETLGETELKKHIPSNADLPVCIWQKPILTTRGPLNIMPKTHEPRIMAARQTTEPASSKPGGVGNYIHVQTENPCPPIHRPRGEGETPSEFTRQEFTRQERGPFPLPQAQQRRNQECLSIASLIKIFHARKKGGKSCSASALVPCMS